VLVLVPEFGDAIQVMKAGLVEVADIIVVNKANHEGAERLVAELIAHGGTEQLILTTQAISGTGIEELYQAIDRRRKKLVKSP